MIDIAREPLLTMAQAAQLVPARNGRKHVAAISIWRWCKYGSRGIKLESVRRPDRTWLTSAAAVGRFLTALAKVNETKPPPDPVYERDWSDDILDAAGII
jgi:hypothetical protein